MKRGDPWYKRCPRDVYDGTRQLSLEARGAYNDILDLIYMHAGSIPDSPSWMAHALHITKRKWLAVRKQLLDAGKITIEAGQIVNARATLEINSRKVQCEANREIAVKRERSKRERAPNSNKIKDPPARTVHHARAFLDTEADTESEKLATTVETEAARSPLAVLNGVGDLMVSDIVGWMHGGTEVSARNWLSTTLATYGQNPTKDAWIRLKTDISTGSAIARPLQAWARIAQRIRDEAPKTNGGDQPKSKTMEIIERGIAAERAAENERALQ